MHATIEYSEEAERRGSWRGLAGLLLGLAAAAGALYVLAGPPRLPGELPSWSTIWLTLQGSYLPLEAAAYVVTTAAWAVWFWIVASLALHALARAVEAVANGAAWARAIRVVSDCVTLPIVRRLVDGAVVAVLVVNLAGRGEGGAGAAPLSVSAFAVVALAPGEVEDIIARGAERGRSERGALEYTVRPGDTLWHIAERFYGSGDQYPRLVAANAGREMPDGRRFERAGVIRPGWVLAIPLPDGAKGGAGAHYIVRPGDTLRAIAARTLGNEMRWGEIFALNRGVARLDDGRVLANPDLIWPGLKLELPRGLAPSEQRPSAAIPQPEPPAPAPTPVARPTVASPTPPPTVPAEPVPTPVTAVPAESSSDQDAYSSTALALGAGALAAAAGGATLAARRARRRLGEPYLPSPAEPDTLMRAGFAEAEFARALAHRIHGGEDEPALLVVEHVLCALAELGLDRVSLVTAAHCRHGAALTLSAGLAERERLLEVAAAVGARLGAVARAEHTPDHDVLLRLDGLKTIGLLAPRGDRPNPIPELVPVGVDPRRETLYANWRELGHVLIAGGQGGCAGTVLVSLVAALAARCRPDELRLHIVAGRHDLPAELAGLPHLQGAIVDPAAQGDVEKVLGAFQAELERRMRLASDAALADEAKRHALPDLALIIGELAGLGDHGVALEALGTHGAAYGLRLVAACQQPEALGDEVLAHFATRLVLSLQDEEQSIRLLGTPDAADLGGGGRMLLRVGGRAPTRASGFRVATEEMARLIQLMIEAYPARWSGAGVDPHSAGPGPLGNALEPWLPDSATQVVEPLQDVDSNGDVDGSFPDGLVTDATDMPSGAAGAQEDDRGPELPLEQPAQPSPTPSPSAAGAEPAAPSIEVRCFGAFRVLAGERELTPAGSGGGQYKAWETLAFIAAQPGGACAKEKLFGALWPDGDSEKGASRLSVTLVRLRQVLAQQVPGLASEVIRSERNGSCRLDTALVASDAVRFWELCRSARQMQPPEAKAAYEEARGLYIGDLLAEPLYEWVHAREEGGLSLQERYREQYYRITNELADLYRREGQTALAVPLYRSLLKLDPTLEEVVRSLYLCYREIGDRTSVIREDRRLKQALREAYCSPDEPDDPDLFQPEPETVALYEEILADLEAKVATLRDR